MAITGYGQEEDRRRCRAAGFDHFLVKPGAPDELFQILEAHRRRLDDRLGPGGDR